MKSKILAMSLGLLTLLSSVAMADEVSVSADVDKYLVATFNYNTVAYGALTHNTNDNVPTPDNTVGEYNVTIDTNYNYTLTANGTALTGAVSSFAVSNLNFGMNVAKGSLSVGDSVVLSSSPQTIESDVPYAQTNDYHGYWLDVPNNQYAESYSSTVTVTYSNEA